MKIRELHHWDVTVAEARALQEGLRARVRIVPLRVSPALVAGIDVSCPANTRSGVAGVVVMRLPGLEIVERRSAAAALGFPYIPGYLSFREGAVVLEALRGLESQPDLFLFDGQGICHPRRCGLAAHVGLILDRPAVGCAKSLLCGRHAKPGRRRGCRRPIIHRGENVGLALRTRDGVRPVYVSVGHRIDPEGAARAVLDCCRGYRIPEPLREAHRWVGELGRALLASDPHQPPAEAVAC